jgi:hypothetical protein
LNLRPYVVPLVIQSNYCALNARAIYQAAGRILGMIELAGHRSIIHAIRIKFHAQKHGNYGQTGEQAARPLCIAFSSIFRHGN